MDQGRNCSFMSGPGKQPVSVPAVKWWLAISRDLLAKGYRGQHQTVRPPALCHRTPTFVSPLPKR